MLEELNGVTSQLASLALDVASLRHEVIANNIANVQTDGYVAKRISFEEHLIGLMGETRSFAQESLQKQQLDELKQRLQSGDLVESSTDETVHLDAEMTKLAQNVIHYQSLLQALKGRGEILRMAISEGR
jgi:flagellar basal-body rod protein FlgB